MRSDLEERELTLARAKIGELTMTFELAEIIFCDPEEDSRPRRGLRAAQPIRAFRELTRKPKLAFVVPSVQDTDPEEI